MPKTSQAAMRRTSISGGCPRDGPLTRCYRPGSEPIRPRANSLSSGRPSMRDSWSGAAPYPARSRARSPWRRDTGDVPAAPVWIYSRSAGAIGSLPAGRGRVVSRQRHRGKDRLAAPADANTIRAASGDPAPVGSLPAHRVAVDRHRGVARLPPRPASAPTETPRRRGNV